MAVRSRSARGALGGLLALLGSLGRSGLLGLPAVLAVLGGVAFAVAGSSPASAGYLSDPMVQGFIPEARAAGMGRAYVAVAEGPSGVWWNPGGLGLADGYWMTPFSLLRPSVFPPYGEEAFRSYGVAGRIRKVGVGLHLNRWHDESSRVYETTQSSFTLGAGVDVAELLRRRSDPALRWGIGASYKRNSEHNEGEGIHPNWKDAHAWDLDVGTLVRVERPVGGRHSFVAVRGAAMLHNLLDQEYGPNGSSMGQEGRYGAGVESGLVAFPPFGHLLHALVTFEGDHSFTDDYLDDNLNFGVEATALGLVTWRYGEFQDHVRRYASSGDVDRLAGQRTFRYVTHGLGLKLGADRLAIHFDYASGTSGTSRQYTFSVHYVP